MNWYLEPLKKYAVFTGRARKKEFWTFTLINIVIGILLTNIDQASGTYIYMQYGNGYGVLNGVFSLIVLIPGIAVMIRRLHDTGRSGFFIFLGLIPIIGFIVLIIFMLQNSAAGENLYGNSPISELDN